MDSLKISRLMLVVLTTIFSVTGLATAQTATGTAPQATQATPAPAAATPKPPAAAQQPGAPLQLHNMGETPAADPFPPINPKYFTADSPSVDTVNAFLKSLWGYDPNRIWRVEAIQKTTAPNMSKVVVFVSDKTPGSKVQPTAFIVSPDGKHAIAGDSVIPFGATPFADTRKMLQVVPMAQRVARLARSSCWLSLPTCSVRIARRRRGRWTKLVKDFPNARLVYQSFPIVDLHPFAFKAAAYGYCVQKQKNDAFFAYSAAVFETQDALTTENGDETLKNAVTKAGLDPAAIDACAATPATKALVDASIKLAQDAGVEQTPMLAVNGHMLPLTGVPYETLKKIITYQASLDGVSTGATSPAVAGPAAPSLIK